MRRYNWYVVGATMMMLVMLFSACRKDNGPRTSPIYTEYTFPASIKVSFPKPEKKKGEKVAKALPDLEFNIDNRTMRAWNKIPLPYLSQYDSLDITIAVSSEATVRIINEKTKKVTEYLSTRRAQRIDATGGKLKVVVDLEKKPTITYDLRILTYGYNPDKFTWTKETTQLPVPAEEASVVAYKGQYYWLARVSDGRSKLYSYNPQKSLFMEVEGTDIPEGISPSSIAVEKGEMAWAITKEQKLYCSNDLKLWQHHNTGNVQISQLIGGVTTIDGKRHLLAIGHEEGTKDFQTYAITPNGVEVKGKLPSGFPVEGAYVYAYTQDGMTAITLYSGKTANGIPATKSFFLAGTIQWGETPYQKKEKVLPNSDGLFLQTDKEAELLLIGGRYGKENKPSGEIKRSSDKGVIWTVLPNQITKGGELLPRYSASGIAQGSDRSLNIYLLGGIINGAPSQEIWHGHLDTTGGIINSFN